LLLRLRLELVDPFREPRDDGLELVDPFRVTGPRVNGLAFDGSAGPPVNGLASDGSTSFGTAQRLHLARGPLSHLDNDRAAVA
jgi:hypothetical protein